MVNFLTYDMKCIVSTILFFPIFILEISWGTVLREYGHSRYRFFPELGDCYEIYNQNEKVTSYTCQRQMNPEKQFCIDLIPDKKYCVGLKTPTNETVEFLCRDTLKEVNDLYYYDLDNCFKVHYVDKTVKRVCQKNFDNYSVGITTPDNFTIMFESHYCSTSTSNDTRKAFNNFVGNYSLDPGLKSCYKIFNPNQTVSPYTCLNKDVHESCVHELPSNKNCTRILTQNNETVILDCAEDEKSTSTLNCFKIYTSDDNVQVACLKKIEERCVGITTPSNLTVLLDCIFCSANGRYTAYYGDAEDNRKYRHFVKSYLDKEYKGQNSYFETIAFEVYFRNEFVEPPNCSGTKPKVYAYWLPNTNCYGITLESNETVVLGCTSKANRVKPGCFHVVNSEQETATVCARVLDELCVGIMTPNNLSVVLACYPLNDCINQDSAESEDNYAEESGEDFEFYPELNECYQVYGESQKLSPYSCRGNANPESYACIDWITGKKGCVGLKTPQNETIVLKCGLRDHDDSFSISSKCFSVYSQEGNVEEVCKKKFGNYSIGITTPNNNSILFGPHFCETKTVETIKMFKQFIENFNFDPDIRSCYKIFTQVQEISPFSCLRRDIYEACIHQLNDSNCTGIKTQNNETVVLHCPNGDEELRKSGCFKIYTSDNKVHTVCQKQLEESCIGIITPSNLSVLFECHTCISTRGNLLPYQNPFRKTLRKFVQNALYNYTHGHYVIGDRYTVFTEKGDTENETVHLLHGHNNCRGLTLRNFETVVLECPSRIEEKNDCFDVYSSKYDTIRNSPDQKVQSVCITILDENCVGIITPKNWTLPLDCTFQKPTTTDLSGISAIDVPNNGMPPRM